MNCPKCGYVRRLDTKVPEGQCPFCGIYYAKFSGTPRGPVRIEPEERADAGGSLKLVLSILFVAGLIAIAPKPAWLESLLEGDEPVARTAAPVVGRNEASRPAAAQRSGIIMYSLTTCGYCKSMRRKFEANNIPFTEYFVDVDQARFLELTQKLQAAGYMGGGIGTPTLDVNGRMMPNNPPFEEVLRQARS